MQTQTLINRILNYGKSIIKNHNDGRANFNGAASTRMYPACTNDCNNANMDYPGLTSFPNIYNTAYS